MLSGKDISFRYKNRSAWILQDFSFALSPGEVVGVRGESGKGKTTLGKILAGFLGTGKGEVTVDGKPLPEKRYCPVQMVFQHPEKAVNPRWRVKKILSEVDAFFPSEETLYNLSINPLWMDRYPHELSGGELQRIAVARILNSNTRYIIADEMTSMLDTVTQAQIWNTVLAFSRKNNVGIAAISHDSELLERITSRIIEID